MKHYDEWRDDDRRAEEDRRYQEFKKLKFLYEGSFEDMVRNKAKNAVNVSLVSTNDSIFIVGDEKKTDLLEGVKLIRGMNKKALTLFKEMIDLQNELFSHLSNFLKSGNLQNFKWHQYYENDVYELFEKYYLPKDITEYNFSFDEWAKNRDDEVLKNNKIIDEYKKDNKGKIKKFIEWGKGSLLKRKFYEKRREDLRKSINQQFTNIADIETTNRFISVYDDSYKSICEKFNEACKKIIRNSQDISQMYYNENNRGKFVESPEGSEYVFDKDIEKIYYKLREKEKKENNASVGAFYYSTYNRNNYYIDPVDYFSAILNLKDENFRDSMISEFCGAFGVSKEQLMETPKITEKQEETLKEKIKPKSFGEDE